MAPSNGHLYLEIVPFLVATLGKKKRKNSRDFIFVLKLLMRTQIFK